MYHEKFPAHPVQRRAPRPPQEAYKSTGGFDGTTTSRATYTAHPIPPRTVRPAYMHKLKLLAMLSGRRASLLLEMVACTDSAGAEQLHALPLQQRHIFLACTYSP